MKITGSTAITTFEDLDCWKQCRVLRLFVAKQVVPVLRRDERYRLGEQLLRAARATTPNIAEGYGRFHYLDNAKFCSNPAAHAGKLWII
jgi:four helix bundle protein